MEGTIRTLDSKMQQQVHERMKITAAKITEASGATVAEVSIDTKTKVTYNDPALVKLMTPSIGGGCGKENVSETEWTTGAEDFSFLAIKHLPFSFSWRYACRAGPGKSSSASYTGFLYR